MAIRVSARIDSPPTVVDGLAFDPVDRRVYYTDTGPHAICSMDVNGDQHRVLVNSGLDQPRSIVLDPKSR
jgi:sugar lactone lactonase YvrE